MKKFPLFPLVLILLQPLTSLAVSTRYIEQNSYFQFISGQFNGVALNDQGYLSLSPSFRSIAGFSESYVWKMAENSKGDILCATGNDGIVRMITGTNARLFHKLPKNQVTALVVDKDDSVLAATSPDGTIFRISQDGKTSKIFALTDSSYVWEMRLDSKGNLIVVTGNDAQLMRIDRSGKKETLFKPLEGNFIGLVLDKNDNMYVAGADSGLVYKVSQTGVKQVLFDTLGQEITAIEIDDKNNLWVATSPLAGRQIFLRPQEQKQDIKPQATSLFEEEKLTSFQPKKKSASVVHKITPQLDFTKVIELENIIFLTMVKDSKGNIIVGSGNNGEIYSISPDDLVTKLTSLDSSQILSLHVTRQGKVLAGTGSLGGVVMIDPQYGLTGTYYSEIFDSNFNAIFGSLSWVAETPQGTSVQFQTRSGNSSVPDQLWSKWTDSVSLSGKSIKSPAARFFQYKAILSTENKGNTPLLTSIKFSSRQNNQTPSIQNIGMDFPSDKPDPKKSSKFKQALAKNERRLTWDALDPNEDDLAFTILFQQRNTPQWMTLKENVKDNYFVMDSLTIPDGFYQFKVRASDEPSNQLEESLTAEAVSPLFLIDNSPPNVTGIKVEKEGDSSLRVSGVVQDRFSEIQSIEYSLNASQWVFILPQDKIYDSPEELFSITLKPLKGNSQLILKVTDKNGNLSTSMLQP